MFVFDLVVCLVDGWVVVFWVGMICCICVLVVVSVFVFCVCIGLVIEKNVVDMIRKFWI